MHLQLLAVALVVLRRLSCCGLCLPAFDVAAFAAAATMMSLLCCYAVTSSIAGVKCCL